MVADPAAGSPAEFRVNSNEVVQIVGVIAHLTTGPFVSDRRMRVLPLDTLGANPTQGSVSSIVQPDSLHWSYWFSCGISPVDATVDASAVYAPLACGIQLQPDEQLQITAYNLQILDQVHGIYVRFYGWKED
jgi:hypothetical protein